MNRWMSCWLCWLWMGLGMAWGQQSPTKIKRQADRLFEANQYEESLAEYQKIASKYQDDLTIKYRMGVCFFQVGTYSKSIDYLTFYTTNSHKPEDQAAYYLARAYHLSDAFAYAAEYYKAYLRVLDQDHPQRPHFKRLILQCTAGAKIQQINARAIVTPLGEWINSPFDDYRICTNPLATGQIFFTSNRPLFDTATTDANLYQSRLRQGRFETARPLSKRYNSRLGEELVDFFDGGYQLLIRKVLDGKSLLFKDNYDQDSVEVLLPFAKNALSAQGWDGDHCFVNDSLVLFASDRPGGYGGRDLYYAFRQNGAWQAPINLGPTLNTPYDESSPVLTRNGLQLYFNSNRPASMGGYDFYQTVFDTLKGAFTTPQNMGVPINSSGDDQDLWLSDDGTTAYLASNRAGGLGGLDLYSVYFRAPIAAQQSSGPAFVNRWQQPALTTTPTEDPPQVIEPTPTADGNEQYTLTPIYYDAETGQLQGSRNTLLALEKMLLRYPNVRVLLSAHANQTGDNIGDLFSTVNQAGIVARRLLQKGVRPEQLYLRGCGQAFPLANNRNFDGSANPIADQINQRIEITVYDQERLPEGSLQLVQPNVNSVMRNLASERYQRDLQGLTYKVYLTQAVAPLRTAPGEFAPITTEQWPNAAAVSYYTRLVHSFADAVYSLDQAKKAGFEQARIVAYIDGFPLDDAAVPAQLEAYPGLADYLAYLRER